MKKYSKPLGKLLDFKQEFFVSNDSKLKAFKGIASIYRTQPARTECKNCTHSMAFAELDCFTTLGVEYSFCPQCGHCNGAYEDTDEFCRALYTDDEGQDYAKTYLSADIQEYKSRVGEIYLPKARFLRDALSEVGVLESEQLIDFGAGAGHFVSAAMECGFRNVTGFEPSETLVNFGNKMIGSDRLIGHDIANIVSLIENSDTKVASFIAVLEHLQDPRGVLKALSKNPHIEYVFFSVPLFSPTVVLESVFTEIMPRHLVAGHTHLYTEQSIQYFCEEFGFERLSEWWFGLDMTDLSRSVSVSLQKSTTQSEVLSTYWTDNFMPLIDKLQNVLDEEQCCSEVHMLLRKKK